MIAWLMEAFYVWVQKKGCASRIWRKNILRWIKSNGYLKKNTGQHNISLMKSYHTLLFLTSFAASLTLLSNEASAQVKDDLRSSDHLKKLNLEELMNIEVTSISMRPEKLTEVASAVQVITGEDIHRSGVTRLPGALRLASNLQMEQANSHDWAITARGFNGLPSAGGVLANKLLVMIDGRSVYSPL